MSGLEPLAMLAAAGSAGEIVGDISGGYAEEAAYDYNARVAAMEGKYAAKASEEKTKQRIGAARSYYGGSGVTTEGSPLLVLSEMAAEGKMEKLNIIRSARAKRQLYRWQGDQARKAGWMKAGSSFIKGLTNVYGMSSGRNGGTSWPGSSGNFGGKNYGLTYGLGGTD